MERENEGELGLALQVGLVVARHDIVEDHQCALAQAMAALQRFTIKPLYQASLGQ